MHDIILRHHQRVAHLFRDSAEQQEQQQKHHEPPTTIATASRDHHVINRPARNSQSHQSSQKQQSPRTGLRDSGRNPQKWW